MTAPRARRRIALLAVGGIAAGVAVGAVAVVAVTGRDAAIPDAAAEAAGEIATLSRSIDFLETRVTRDPENFLAAAHLADRLVLRFQLAADERDLTRAAAVARRAAASTPDPAGAQARLSGIELARHEFAAALAAAEQAVASDAASPAAHAALFDAAMASGHYGRADTALRHLPERSATRHVRSARWAAAHGRTADADAALTRTCDAFRAQALRGQVVAWCLTELAALRAERYGPDAAKPLLRDALAAQPGYRGAIEMLADLAHARGAWREAQRLYATIASDAHPDLELRRAEVARALGDTATARAHAARFRALTADARREPLHAIPLATFLAADPATRDAALAVMRRDLARRTPVESWDALAWVHLQRGELAAALAASDSAMRWGAPSATMQYRRGRILQAMGRHREARPLLADALARPDLLDPDVRAALAQASSADGP